MPETPFLTFQASGRGPRIEPSSGRPIPDYVSPSRAAQGGRLVPQLTKLEEALEQKVLRLDTEAPGYAAEEILVLTVAGGIEEFIEVLSEVDGFEWLGDEKSSFSPDENGFRPKEENKESFGGLLYLFSSNLAALQQLKSAWKQKAEGKPLSGITSKLGKILDRVVEIRCWDWRDRLRDADIAHWKEEAAIGAEVIRFEAELWFRKDRPQREADQNQLQRKVVELGGMVLSNYEHLPSGYLGQLIELPAEAALTLLEDPAATELFQESSVFHFWPVGQALHSNDEDPGDALSQSEPDVGTPEGSPRVALLDGLPVANHPLLADRLKIDDPDDWATDYLVNKRAHGTHMASLICLGDLSKASSPLSRPLYVRPIMRPQPLENVEHIPSDTRANDLLERAVRRMKLGDAGEVPAAYKVSVINLSIGDRSRIYDGNGPSALARMIDWLQWKYKILFLVSAGNAPTFQISASFLELEQLSPEDLEKAFLEFVQEESRELRLLSPAESINAITVGAHHSDESTGGHLGAGNLQPIRHPDLPSPSSRVGPGFLRAVKPDLLMPGGRQPIAVIGDTAKCYQGHLAPGQKVAAPPAPGEIGPRTKFIRGTSGATALATRQAALLIEQLENLDPPPPADYMAILTKALLVHGASWQDADTHLRSLFGNPGHGHSRWKGSFVSPLVGFGRFDETLFSSIHGHRASVLGWDSIRVDEAIDFKFPIPPSLANKRGMKRFTVTLAYFSPVNPHNRKYRSARVSFKFKESVDDLLGNDSRKDVDYHQGKKGTVQHEVYQGITLRGIIEEEFVIRVECIKDGESFDEAIPFALAVTLEGAEDIFPSIRSEIVERLQTTIPVAPERVPI